MNVQLKRITIEEKEALKNLMQFYFYDFSELTNADVSMNGTYGVYPNLDDYFYKQNTHYPYFIVVEGTIVGFALVKQLDTGNTYAIGEFFVLRRYRRNHIGYKAAKQLFGMYKGDWEIFQLERNVRAQEFWRKVIADVTGDEFQETTLEGRVTQTFTV